MVAKETIVDNLSHDWIIHADADEWLQSPLEGESLISGIRRLSARINAINFEEFVFLPTPGGDFAPRDYDKTFLDYYYFAPSENRLMRAWRRADRLSNKAAGGHRLTGTIHLAPENFILRHYIGLSYPHFITKYLGRKFSDGGNLSKGWHGNRLNLSGDKLILPGANSLKRLTMWNSKEFDRSAPKETHFWEWQK